MTIPSTRKLDIEHGLKDQTSIALDLLNTILENASTRAELECYWEVIKHDISIPKFWEARERQCRNQE